MADSKRSEGWGRRASRPGKTGGSGRLSGFAIGAGAGSLLYHFAPHTTAWPAWVIIAAAAAAIVAGSMTVVWERGRSVVVMMLGAVGAVAGVIGLVLAFRG